MARLDYVVIPTGFAVAYRTPRGDYVAVSEHLDPKSAERDALQRNAAAVAEEAASLAAMGRPARVLVRDLPGQGAGL